MAKAKSAKPKKARKPKLNKAKKQTLIDEKIAELLKARAEFSESVDDWEEAHAQAGAKKKTMEAKQGRINSIVNDIQAIQSGNYTPPLPFGEDNPAESNGSHHHTPGTLKANGAWKDVFLDDLFKGQIRTALADANLNTLGELTDFQASNKQLSDIKGIGPGKAEKISDRLIEFWKEHPEYCDKGESEEATESEAEEPAEAE